MSAGIIISVILILALLAAGIVFLVLFLRERNNKTTTPDVSMQGHKFKLLSDTSVQASWDSVGDDTDNVMFYASLKTINVDPNTGEATGEDILKQGPVKGNSTKTLTINNLTPETRYNVALVISNTISDGKSISNQINDVIYTDTFIEGEFSIFENNSVGYIELQNNNTDVKLVKNDVNKTSIADLWEYDFGQFGTTTTYHLFSKAVNDTPELVLYKDDKGLLSVKNVDDLTPDETKNARWEWVIESVKGKKNTIGQWCLKDVTPRTCMSVKTAPTKTTPSDITVEENLTTQFKNVPPKSD